MTDLAELLGAALAADPSDRILLRDPIAEFGAEAIPAMSTWLDDPRVGAFAVRVLWRIADQPANRREALNTLASAETDRLPEYVARDIAAALNHFAVLRADGGTRARAAPRGQPDAWPGGRTVSPLELRFHDEMLSIFTLAGEATRKIAPDGSTIRGYWASYFLRGVRNHGGPAYARQLLRAQGTSDGFQRLTDEHRLDLTVEALVLRPEFAALFTEDERAVASSRLARAGFQWQ